MGIVRLLAAAYAPIIGAGAIGAAVPQAPSTEPLGAGQQGLW